MIRAMNRVSLEYPSFQDFLQKCSPFISEQGMFVRTDEIQPVGAEVGFDVGLGSDFPILRGAGKVEWVVEPDPEGIGAPGMALRYTETDDATQRLIRKIAEKHREQTGEIFALDRPEETGPPSVGPLEEIEGSALAAALPEATEAEAKETAEETAADAESPAKTQLVAPPETPDEAEASSEVEKEPRGETAEEGDVLSLPVGVPQPDKKAVATPAVLPPGLEEAEGPARGGRAGLWVAVAALVIAAVGFWQRDFVAEKLGMGSQPAATTPVEAPLETIDVEEGPTATEEAAAADPAEVALEEPVEATTAPAAPPQRAPLTRIEDISWLAGEGSTLLMLRADGTFGEDSYQVESMGGNAPRAILKISGVTQPYQAGTTDVGTAEVLRARTGLHPSGLHVVLDLASSEARVVSTEVDGVVLQVRVSTGAASP
jgi:Tfp pilus assembly protein PilZ